MVQSGGRPRWWIMGGIFVGVVLAAPAGFIGAAMPLVGPWTALATLALNVGMACGLTAWGVQRRAGALNAASSTSEFRDELERRLAIRDAMITGLAKLADYRESENGRHVDRMSEYAALLARRLMPVFKEINEGWVRHVRVAASLHDIGKFGVPDAVLLKPAPLDDDERAMMERHVSLGADTLLAVRRRLGHDDLMDMSVQVALEHHERWDGAGYPLGMRGEHIPLAARIVAVADTYDALTSRRTYREAVSHERAAIEIARGRGTRFDPRICDAFLAAADEFNRIRTRVPEKQLSTVRRAA